MKFWRQSGALISTFPAISQETKPANTPADEATSLCPFLIANLERYTSVGVYLDLLAFGKQHIHTTWNRCCLTRYA